MSEESLHEKLKTEIEKAAWPILEDHHKRESLYFISDDLNLLDVSVAVAQDDVEKVKSWLHSEQLARPSDEKLKQLKEEPEIEFHFIIIQPYVLAKEIKD